MGTVMNEILVVGSLNLDFVINVEHMPVAGETILGDAVALIPGGKGANQAYAVGKLGGVCKMIGAVGEDHYGELLIRNLQSVEVNTQGINVLENKPTGNAFITVNREGDNNIIVVPGANGCLTKAMIDTHMELLKVCSTVILQLEIPLEVVTYVIQLAKELGKRIILDPAPARRDFPEGFFKGIDIVKPNETELQMLIGRKLSGTEEMIDGAKELILSGVKTVIVTLGGEGCLLVNSEGHQYFPARKVTVVDTTAAGDSFTAALAVALEKGSSYEEAITFANKVSGMVVTKKGAQTSIPSIQEVENSN